MASESKIKMHGPVPLPLTTPKQLSQTPLRSGPRGGQYIKGADGKKHWVKK